MSARAGTYLSDIPKSVYQIADILHYANDRMEKTLCSQCQKGNRRETVTFREQMSPDFLNSYRGERDLPNVTFMSLVGALDSSAK